MFVTPVRGGVGPSAGLAEYVGTRTVSGRIPRPEATTGRPSYSRHYMATLLDETLQVRIADDGLTAHLLCPRSYPGRGIKARHVIAFLRERAVVHGVRRELIEEFLDHWKRGIARSPYLIARGDAPRAPTDGALRRLHPPARSGKDPVELLPLYVKKGEGIIAVDLPTPGESGRDVRGATLSPPESRRPLALKAGRGLEVCGRVWQAARSGFLVEQDGCVIVSRTLTHLHDLQPAEYRWEGNAEIHGAVLAGTRLSIRGNVWIQGDVEDGVHIEAGGQLKILGEVRGGGTARLTTDGEIRVRTLRDTSVVADGDIIVEESCLNCSVRTRGRFLANTSNCRVTGGKIEAVSGASFFDVGCERRTRTQISVGWSEWFDEELYFLERQIRRWNTYYAKLHRDFRDRHRSLLEHRQRIYKLSRKDRRAFEGARERVHQEQHRVDAKVSEIRNQQARLYKKRARDEKAVVRIEGRARAGTIVAIRGKSFTVRDRGLSAIVLQLSRTSGRVLPIPLSLVDSSEIEVGVEPV